MYLKELYIKNENPVIVYLPSCCFKTVWRHFLGVILG